MDSLNGKVALVTGSSRGIGAAIAMCFARHGAQVALHGRDEKALTEVHAAIEKSGGVAIQCFADITKFDEIEAMRRTIGQALGPIDVLVANAGGNYVPPHRSVEEISEEDWRRSLDGNVTATFLTMKSVVPEMKARKHGNIITMSSAAARRPHPMSPLAYSVAKAGIQVLTQNAAAQLGPFNIRVNCIAPETILTEKNLTQIPQAQQLSMIEGHPIRRLGTPEDVADAALFLASEGAGWITGVVLDVAGGAVMVR